MSDRDEEQEASKGFRVVDRRRFTSEGELRSDAPPDPPAAAEPVEPPKPTPRAEEPAAARGASAPREAQRPADPGEAQRPADPRGAQTPADDPASADAFLRLVEFFAISAQAAMGLLPPEQGGGQPPDFGAAREHIDMMVMLQKKTRGNLSRQEESVLGQLVSTLQLQFVEVTRRKR